MCAMSRNDFIEDKRNPVANKSRHCDKVSWLATTDTNNMIEKEVRNRRYGEGLVAASN